VQNAPTLPSCAVIAHLSDLHMLEARPAQARSVLELSMRFAAFGQAPTPNARIARLAAAVRAARDAGAAHLVISGDLTELGTPEQFETFAEVLADARIDPDRVTLVPGNHDAYTRADSWRRALEGPLAPFRRTSAAGNGTVVERARAFILPLDVACHQHFTRAAGELTTGAADALEARVRDLSGRGRPVVIVVHHSPIAHRPRAWQWLHGLRGGERILDLLARYPDVHVLHGHLHHEVELSLDGRRPRVFGAPAVVDDPERSPRVRLYEAAGSFLRSLPAAKGRSRRQLAA
jgi:Icc protein